MLWAPTLSYLFPSSFRYRLQSFPFNRATCPQPNSWLSGHALAYPWLRRHLLESLFAQHWSFCYCLSLGLEPPSVTQETPIFTWFQLSQCHSHPTEISLDTDSHVILFSLLSWICHKPLTCPNLSCGIFLTIPIWIKEMPQTYCLLLF